MAGKSPGFGTFWHLTEVRCILPQIIVLNPQILSMESRMRLTPIQYDYAFCCKFDVPKLQILELTVIGVTFSHPQHDPIVTLARNSVFH